MITIVLPAYNEEQVILPLLNHFSKLFEEHFSKYRLIVIDDGSTDRTTEIVRSYRQIPIELIEHETNKGVGTAIKTGLIHAIRFAEDDDILITMDSDNTHNPALILRMVALIAEGNDVVIASRFVSGARVVGVSLVRQLYSLGAAWLFKLLFPISGVRDYTCGYRAYRAGLLKRAFERWGNDFITSSGFSCQVELLLRLHKLNAIMNEIPLILRYDLKGGKSKMNVTQTIKDTLVVACRRWVD